MKSTNPYLAYFNVDTEEELEKCFEKVNEEIVVDNEEYFTKDNEEYFTKDNEPTTMFYINKI